MSSRGRWAMALLALLAIAPHLGALRNDFVFDDNGVIVRNEAVTRFSIEEIWTRPYWPELSGANLYRPLTSSSFALSWAMSDGSPGGFVAANLLLHAAVTILAFCLLLRRILPGRPGIAAAASILFAVHPIHVEAVAGIVGRAELLAALFGILSYSVWLRSEVSQRFGATLAAAALWLLAVLSKEGALALPGIFLLHRLGVLSPASTRKELRPRDSIWTAALAVAVVLRLNALGGIASPAVNRIDNPLAPLDLPLRVLGAGGVFLRQLSQLLLLIPFSPDYSFAEVRPGGALYAAGFVTLALLCAALLWAFRRARDNPAGYGILFFFFAWVVTSNLLVPIGTAQADRIFYLPSLGIFMAAATIVGALTRRWGGRPAWFILAAATLVFAVASGFGTAKWRTESKLFESALRAAPRSVKVRSNLAAIQLQRRDPETGRRVLELLAPVERDARGFGPYLHWKAKATLYAGDAEEARRLFREALAARADSSEVLVELGNIAIMEGDGAEAMRAFEPVARIGKLAMHGRIGVASALSLQGRYAESAQEWAGILEALPDSIPVRVAYAWNIREADRPSEAVEILREGLDRSDDARLWGGLSEALLAEGRAAAALDAARRAVERHESEENLTNLALALIASGNRDEARNIRRGVQDPELLEEIDQALAACP